MRLPGRRAGAPPTRRDPWKTAFFGAAALALVVAVAWAILGSSLLVVRSVRVSLSGPRLIARSAVLAAARVPLGTPLVRVDTRAVVRRLERLRQVQSARVSRSWPDGLDIWVRARTAVLAVPAHGGYDRVDAYGVVLGWSAKRPRRLMLMTPAPGLSALQTTQAESAAGTVVRDLPRWLRRRVIEVRASGPSAVTLTIRGGATVLWGDAARPAAKASALAILLRTGARYYDVSDPVTAVTGSSPVTVGSPYPSGSPSPVGSPYPSGSRARRGSPTPTSSPSPGGGRSQ